MEVLVSLPADGDLLGNWTVDSRGRPKRMQDGAYVYLHRLVAARMIAPKLLGYRDRVLYVNGKRVDCRRENLVIVPYAQQGQHKYTRRTAKKFSRYQGVTWSPVENKWKGTVYYHPYPGAKRKAHHVGFFDVEEDAARARDEVAKKLVKSTLVLNFPKG